MPGLVSDRARRLNRACPSKTIPPRFGGAAPGDPNKAPAPGRGTMFSFQEFTRGRATEVRSRGKVVPCAAEGRET